MARKLSDSERRRREQEKKRISEQKQRERKARTARNRAERERLAAESRAKTAARRAKNKTIKEFKERQQANLGKLYSVSFQLIVDSLSNLTLSLPDDLSAQDYISLPEPIKNDYPGDLKFTMEMAGYSSKSILPKHTIESLEKEKNTDYKEFKSIYGSFLKNLFGTTKKEYESYIRHKTEDYRLKKEFINNLAELKKLIKQYNESALEKLKADNTSRKQEFKPLKKKINAFNEKLDDLELDVQDALASIDDESFIELFRLGLPIKFEELDNNVAQLIKKIKELDKNFYSSPSNNFNYGVSGDSEGFNLFISYDDRYFPLPSEQQVNSIKKGYSIRSLTKKNKEYIINNMVPSAALVYAKYAFNSSEDLDSIEITVGKETVDGTTGSDTIELDYSLSIDREKFIELQLDKIVPSETIELFKLGKPFEILDGVQWNKQSVRKGKMTSKINVIKKEYKELLDELQSFSRQTFNPPSQSRKISDLRSKLKSIIAESKRSKNNPKKTHDQRPVQKDKPIGAVQRLMELEKASDKLDKMLKELEE